VLIFVVVGGKKDNVVGEGICCKGLDQLIQLASFHLFNYGIKFVEF